MMRRYVGAKQAKGLLNHIAVALILIISFSFKNHEATKGSIKVIVTNIKNTSGQIGFCLFKSSEGFPHPEKASIVAFVKIKGTTCTYTFTNMDAGTYAVSVFHDENSDKTLNTNFLGIPKEGVGISNNAKGHFGPPKFEDAEFNFNQSEQIITISMSYL